MLAVGERTGIDGAALARTSRLVAKVDSAAVQDGFDPYLHGFIVADDGQWVVVQQGMHGERKQARRYHWLSDGLESFVDAPYAAIDGPGQRQTVDLADRRAPAQRDVQVALLYELGPARLAHAFSDIDAPDGRPRGRAPRLLWRRRSCRPIGNTSRRCWTRTASRAGERGPAPRAGPTARMAADARAHPGLST